jgi:hypothetical protein
VSDQAAFQEVDDAFRQDEMKAWWKRYGTYAVAAAVVVVVIVAGVVGYRQYEVGQRVKAGAAYDAALGKIGQDNKAARAELDQQAQSAVEPYRTLAALTAAQLRDTPEERTEALMALAPKLKGEFSDLAQVIAGFQSVDTSKSADIIGKLAPLAEPNRPFHSSVTELQALDTAKKGDAKRARELWTDIVKDPASPQGAQQRAQAMLNLSEEQGAK